MQKKKKKKQKRWNQNESIIKRIKPDIFGYASVVFFLLGQIFNCK